MTNKTIDYTTEIALKVDNAITDFIKEELSGWPPFRTYSFNMNKIAEAIEKQIPTKPKYIPLETYQCPKCKNQWLRQGQEYCDRCGTKLDWSDDK